MIIDVSEQDKLGSLNGGFSISPEGLVGQLSLSGKNLYGTGQDVSLQFDRGILGKAVMNWSLDYQSRTLVEGSDFLNIKLFNNTSHESSPKAHLLNRVGAEASLAYPWADVQLIFGLRHEAFTKEYTEEDLPVEKGLTDALSLTLNYDDRNNPIFATRGGLESFRVEQAGLFALGTEFTKLQATAIRHFPTLEDQNVAVRLVGGLGLDLEDDPQEQFLLGGSMTLRGIASQRTPSMAYLNLEYRIQFIPGVLAVALFADVGTGFPWQLKKSVGIEGRFTLPYLGPVRFAFAWPITDRIEYFKVEYGFGSFF
jgi:outer membrane protein assembly factor BamA